MNTKSNHTRVDIQALRGVAVLLVVFYHAKIGGLAGGYLGVDVFLVISGYLITQLVASGILRGDFSLKEFYFRRAKRLLPAAYVTFAITAALAPWFLNQLELADLVTQLIGAVTFTGNFVLWQQTGYFEGASDLKPLLHMWSLAIEEQYYFILPLTLLLTRPNRWLFGVFVLIIFSLSLCVLGGIFKPIATFYLLPTRAWEMLIGSAGALWTLRASPNRHVIRAAMSRFLLTPALLCLALVPVVPFGAIHPGVDAFLVCISTLVVLLCDSPTIKAAALTKVVARVGDFSYALYMVHWPIIAFAKNAWVGGNAELPMYIRVTTLLLSFVLAYLLYKFIEDPIRKKEIHLSKPLVGKIVLSSIFLTSITPIVLYAMPKPIDYQEARRTNYGFSEACEYKNSFISTPECRNSETPTLLVWGDSFAMHLVPGLTHEWRGGGIVQATRSQCGPFLGIAPRNIVKSEGENYKDLAWAKKCIEFNQSVIEYLRATQSVKIVVLSSPLSQYVTSLNLEHVIQKDKLFISVPVNADAALAGLRRTVEEIHAMGKKVVLIAPPPSADFNIGGCLERQLSGAVALGGRPGCLIDRVEYQKLRANVLNFLTSAEADVGISVIRFEPWLCDVSSCRTMLSGTMVYRDAGHLSYAGSQVLAERMHLAQLIVENAK